MNYILFEDLKVDDLRPFSLNHTSFELRCGMYTNIQRVLNIIDPSDKLYLIVRPGLEDITRERYPNLIINPSIIPSGIMLNGATVWTKKLVESIEENKVYSSSGRVIAMNREVSTNLDDFYELLKESIHVTLDINVVHIEYLWDLIFSLSETLLNDSIEISIVDSNHTIHSSAIINKHENIIINSKVDIGAGVVLDSTNGPIIIDQGAKIDIGALIQGPIYIGKHTVINPGAKLRGNISIGPVCKIGGELEDVVIHGYTNKQHDGYLGHSFLGEWINVGANTNNSDLKNNYSTIRMNISKDFEINTLKQFLGVFIGDYAKTGISTMINSGTFIGLGANVFGSGFQPKYIESFGWGREDRTDFEKFIITCKKIKERRKLQMSEVEIKLLKKIYENI